MCRTALKAIKEALFPLSFTCDLCGIETFGYNICIDCLTKFDFNDGNVCPVCGRNTVRPEICYECKSKTPLFKMAVSPFIYSEGAQALIKKFKQGSGYLNDYFAERISEKLKHMPPFDCIVYVPMTRSATKKRGYNQTKLLALRVSAQTDVPVIKDALRKVKPTKPQKDLSRKERAINLEGSFEVTKKSEILGKRLLLIDDILTTGATADEITKILLKAKAQNVYLATIASVPIILPSFYSIEYN